ncbi:MAG: ATP-dependent helicase [Chloroflexota bacterium]|nr:ATP-dependent helicase [Chloroflexota bacterium]
MTSVPTPSLPLPSPALGRRREGAPPVSLATVKALLQGLNREQRQAVTHRTGPLVVIAGPGTGKTEVVTRRVAWLIAAKLARPREILALTFTDNAAQEMQARVDALVPYGQADTAIHTFHAFGDRLLREHAFELGLPGDVRLINRAEAITLLREHLFELGLDRYRPLGDPTRFLGALVDLFGRAKDEAISARVFQEHANDLLERIASATDRVDPVLADVAGARSELARAYAAYCDLLARRGLIDHADQVALPLDMLRQRPAVRRRVHDRYSFLLVDELQDTNRAQLELVLELTGPARNVMVVGDPDQGIYTFRGALAGNLARFEAAQPGLRRIVLRRNYRSRAPIIEASARLVAHTQAPGAGAARQVAHRRSRRPAPVRCHGYETPEAEVDAIAAEIAQRIAKGARPSDFAVLARSNSETDAIRRALLARGVPAHDGSRAQIDALPAVRALLALLRVVADPSNSLELYALAASEPYLLGGAELNALLQAGRRRHRTLWQVVGDIADGRAGDLLEPEPAARVTLLVEHVRAALGMSADHASGAILYDYLRRSGMLARLARLDQDGPDVIGLRGVARFFQLVRDRATLLAHDRVPFLVPHLERVGSELADADDTASDGDHVPVLTVHRAKGLEFKIVFLSGLVDGRFPVRGRAPLLTLPPELASGAADDDGLAEERRLFYVAMTRARDELWLTYHRAGPGGRGRRRPSPFLGEALDMPPPVPVAVARATSADGDETERIRQTLQPPVPPLAAGAAGAAASLSLSFSQVDDYLSCPERYRLRYVVGLPTPAHHALAYGSALHQAVAAFHVRQGRGATMSEAELLAEFARHWTAEGFLSREHEEARYVAGQETLRRFRQQQLASGSVPIAIERPFRFRLGRDQIVGRVDRLDGTAQGVVITDYKSSDVRDQKRADNRARESLQLQVYALAHQAETGALPARVQLHFLDSGVVGRATPERGQLERAQQTLSHVADGIRAGRFDPKPNPVACGYCPFARICPVSAA